MTTTIRTPGDTATTSSSRSTRTSRTTGSSVEQLAGDELDEVNYDTLIATSFHRIGPRVLFREKQNPHYRYDYLDDMIGTTSRAFLGLTVACARCHDHKFDPISQMDYYRMMADLLPVHRLRPSARRRRGSGRVRGAERQRSTRRSSRSASRSGESKSLTVEAAFEKRLETFPEDVQIAVRTPEEQRTPGQKLLATQMLSVRNNGMRSDHG